MIKIQESLRVTYGGLPSGGGFSPSSEYVVGMSKIGEACHCILGSLQRTQERLYKGSDPEDAMKSEFAHIDEEIGIIETVIDTYSKDTYINLLNKSSESDVRDFVRKAERLKKLAQDQRAKLFTETYQDGTPKPVVEMAEEAYGFLITFCSKIIDVHKDSQLPVSFDDNVYSHFMLRIGVEYLRKQFNAYRNFETLDESYSPNMIRESVIREEHGLEESDLTYSELVNLRGAIAYNKQVDRRDRIGFDYNGTFVTNPLKDETGEYEVDPVDYYGIDLIIEFLRKYDRIVQVA